MEKTGTGSKKKSKKQNINNLFIEYLCGKNACQKCENRCSFISFLFFIFLLFLKILTFDASTYFCAFYFSSSYSFSTLLLCDTQNRYTMHNYYTGLARKYERCNSSREFFFYFFFICFYAYVFFVYSFSSFFFRFSAHPGTSIFYAFAVVFMPMFMCVCVHDSFVFMQMQTIING